jgi:hypothetical protein
MKGIVIMAKNDDRILELMKQIEAKKNVLAEKKVRFSPETTCVLELDGVKHNLSVCSNEMLNLLMVKLNMYVLSAKDLNVPIPVVSGFDVELWISDIKSKLAVAELKKEENDLKNMEIKLNKLLSDDKKTELELDEVAALLN